MTNPPKLDEARSEDSVVVVSAAAWHALIQTARDGLRYLDAIEAHNAGCVAKCARYCDADDIPSRATVYRPFAHINKPRHRSDCPRHGMIEVADATQGEVAR